MQSSSQSIRVVQVDGKVSGGWRAGFLRKVTSKKEFEETNFSRT